MTGSSYHERDYAFGQQMLAVRTRLALTQIELAQMLGVGRRTVIDWEGGLTYPTVEHLKHFVVLAMERQSFPAGQEAEEVRALWHAAHQKVLLDDAWLAELQSHAGASQVPTSQEESGGTPALPFFLPGADDVLIGATHPPKRASMGGRGNGTCSRGGSSRSVARW
jgi:transcriptional regulator with XRE-family HTH domain